MYNVWNIPGGTYSRLYDELLSKPHVLVAGATGSGKSIVVNGLIYTALYRTPGKARFILIDPKRVELKDYAALPHTITHAAGHNPAAWEKALKTACDIMDSRYNSMRGKQYDGSDIYVIIDEFADIKKSGGRNCYNMVLRLLSEGRAAKVHCIIATQVPNAQILPTECRGNISYRIALRTQNKTESRIIMDCAGCEDLPDFGYGYYVKPGRNGLQLYKIPYTDQKEIERLIDFWQHNSKPKRHLFKPAI